jgi:hypothetical protein
MKDQLAGSRQVVLIVRMVLDGKSRLQYGELLDVETAGMGRFTTVNGLGETVKRWLERQRRVDGSEME